MGRVKIYRWITRLEDSSEESSLNPLTKDEMNLTVSDMRQEHEWDWGATSFDIPLPIKERIEAIPFQEYGNGEDSIMWKYSKDGEVTTNSAYLQVRDDYRNDPPFQGYCILKLNMLLKVINFLCLCHHNSVPIRDVFASRGINYGHTCPLCNCHRETIIHLLQDCAHVQDFWSKI